MIKKCFFVLALLSDMGIAIAQGQQIPENFPPVTRTREELNAACDAMAKMDQNEIVRRKHEPALAAFISKCFRQGGPGFKKSEDKGY